MNVWGYIGLGVYFLVCVAIGFWLPTWHRKGDR